MCFAVNRLSFIPRLWARKISLVPGKQRFLISDFKLKGKSMLVESIKSIFNSVLKNHTNIEFGAHLHSDPISWYDKIDSAFHAGCRRFDGAIKGFGGCPMASNKLVGNMPTEKILSYLNTKKISNNVNSLRFESCYNQSLEIFNKFH